MNKQTCILLFIANGILLYLHLTDLNPKKNSIYYYAQSIIYVVLMVYSMYSFLKLKKLER